MQPPFSERFAGRCQIWAFGPAREPRNGAQAASRAASGGFAGPRSAEHADAGHDALPVFWNEPAMDIRQGMQDPPRRRPSCFQLGPQLFGNPMRVLDLRMRCMQRGADLLR